MEVEDSSKFSVIYGHCKKIYFCYPRVKTSSTNSPSRECLLVSLFWYEYRVNCSCRLCEIWSSYDSPSDYCVVTMEHECELYQKWKHIFHDNPRFEVRVLSSNYRFRKENCIFLLTTNLAFALIRLFYVQEHLLHLA